LTGKDPAPLLFRKPFCFLESPPERLRQVHECDLPGGEIDDGSRWTQATDRVHRIVKAADSKVFKLVTQGTLEEKISAIIDRNRNLMDDVIKEDSAELLKAFNREDLLVMLTPEPF